MNPSRAAAPRSNSAYEGGPEKYPGYALHCRHQFSVSPGTTTGDVRKVVVPSPS